MTLLEIFVGIPIIILLLVLPFVLIYYLIELTWYLHCRLHIRSSMGMRYTVEHIKIKSRQFIDILRKRPKNSSGWSKQKYYLDAELGILRYLEFFDKGHCDYSGLDIDFDLSWSTDMKPALRKEFVRFLKKSHQLG